MATQWRALIAYRKQLVRRRVQVQNTIRAIFDRQGLGMPAGPAGWTKAAIAQLAEAALPLERASVAELWRGQLHMELRALAEANEQLNVINKKLSALAVADERCVRLMEVPGVGPRLAEIVVASIDDPHRFKSGRQVGAYAGLVPRRYQSGATERQGRITRAGNTLLRTMLVEVSWIGLRHNPWLKAVYENARGGSPTRKKSAIVAAARRLLVVLWAMLRDGTQWSPPPLKTAGVT